MYYFQFLIIKMLHKVYNSSRKMSPMGILHLDSNSKMTVILILFEIHFYVEILIRLEVKFCWNFVYLDSQVHFPSQRFKASKSILQKFQVKKIVESNNCVLEYTNKFCFFHFIYKYKAFFMDGIS